MKTTPKSLIVSSDDGDDPDMGFAGIIPVLIPEGRYHVGFVRSAPAFKFHGEERVVTVFQVTDPGEHFGKELSMWIRTSPRREEKQMAFSSKLTRLAAVALGRSDMRRDRLRPKMLFQGKLFLGLVTTVTMGYRKKPIPLAAQYSKLDDLIEKVAG